MDSNRAKFNELPTFQGIIGIFGSQKLCQKAQMHKIVQTSKTLSFGPEFHTMNLSHLLPYRVTTVSGNATICYVTMWN